MRLQENVVVAGVHLPLKVRRCARSRHMTLRYQPLEDAVSLTLPRRVPNAEALRFVQERISWLENQRQMYGARVRLRDGEKVPCLGEELVIRHTGSLRGLIEIADGELKVPGAQEHVGRRVHDFLRRHLHSHLQPVVAEKASLIGKKPRRIRVRETTSRWGSCNSDGDLSFSWRLVFAPPHVLDYIASHEVAHLKEMNHSVRFWKLVENLCPQWRDARAWLRNEGHLLYCYQF